MGLSSLLAFHAWNRAGPGCADDRRQAQAQPAAGRIAAGLILTLCLWAGATPVRAQDQIRIAQWATPLTRAGPGLLLRDILRGEDPQIAAVLAVLAEVEPDILVLTDIDYDAGLAALTALADALRAAGPDYSYLFALKPNAGLPTGLDLDGDGRIGTPRDAQGYGLFAGNGGMAVLSRLPLEPEAATDVSALIWRDLPWASLPERDGAPFPGDAALAVQRLSSVGHWIVPVRPKGAAPFSLLISSATPPVFDGPEDRNGLRNRDELRLWTHVLDGEFGPPPTDFVLAANTNLDPVAGDGFSAAMVDFLADPRLQDPAPRSAIGGLNTARWPEADGPGDLRVSYLLPSAGWRVLGAGVVWPAPDDPLSGPLGPEGQAAGPHRLIWVDLTRE